MAKVIYRLVKVAQDAGLVFENTSIGITGRAGISGNKPKLALKYLEELDINHKIDERVVFVDDGLARGAAVMARCMNSLGTIQNPLGGHSGGKCILGQRIKLQGEVAGLSCSGHDGTYIRMHGFATVAKLLYLFIWFR